MADIPPIAMIAAFFSSASVEDPLAGHLTEPKAVVDCNRVTHFGRWIGTDDDGENTREEVLVTEPLIPVT